MHDLNQLVNFFSREHSRISPLLDPDDRTGLTDFLEHAGFPEQHSSSEQHSFPEQRRDLSSSLNSGLVDRVLKAQREELLTYLNPNASLEAKHVLFTFTNKGSWEALRDLIPYCMADSRISDVSIHAAGAGFKAFSNSNLSLSFKDLRPKLSSASAFTSVLDLYDGRFSSKAPDIVVATPANHIGPEALALLNAKRQFGASRLYYLAAGWDRPSPALSAIQEHFDQIDGVFCNDELAKQVCGNAFPAVSAENLFATGTGQIEPSRLRVLQQDRQEMRLQLGLSDSDKVLLFLGTIEGFFKGQGISPTLNQSTWELTLSAVSELAEQQPDQSFAIVLRPHHDDPAKDILLSSLNSQVPSNLKLVLADNSVCSIDQACVASDLIAGVWSTEVYKAPGRGLNGVFLWFEESGLGADLADTRHDSGDLEAIRNAAGIKVVGGKEELKAALSDCSKVRRQSISGLDNYCEKIVEVMVS